MAITIQTGFWIVEGWVSRAQMYASGTKIVGLPVQSDMSNGRQWLRPGNAADIIKPASFIDVPSGARFGYGGLVFKWPLQSMSPNMVKYLQETYFSPSVTPASFFHRTWYNKLTVQTFNRSSGDWEAYHVYGRFGDPESEAEPVAGGLNNLLVSFTAFEEAPDGPDISVNTGFSGSIYQDVEYTFTFTASNIGDSDTFNAVYLNYAIPTNFDFVSFSSADNTTLYYSIDDGDNYSVTPPVDLDDVTNIRVLYSDGVDSGASIATASITIYPNTASTFNNIISMDSDGDIDTSNNTNTRSVTINAFSPIALSGLVLWLDANVDVYQDGGSSVVATNGSLIDQWRDQSTSSFTASQATIFDRPTYLTGQANGNAAVQFSGAEHMNFATIGLSSGPFMVFFVVDPTNDDTATVEEYLLDSETGRLTFAHIDGDTGKDDVSILEGSNWKLLDAAQSGLQLYTFENSSANGALFYRDGTLVNTLSTNEHAIGGNTNLGADYNGTASYYDGLIYEVVLYNVSLTSTNRGLVTTYLKSKYGIV